MLGDFLKALAQIGDRRFRRVLLLGVGLSLALLATVTFGFLWALQLFLPDSITLPWVGSFSGLDDIVGWGSALLMIGLSVFLMIPVASAFSGFFLDDVAQAVEDRHYPGLPPALKLGLGDQLIDSANFFALLVAVNLVALVLYFVAGPLAPVLFWGLNGFLLGREYFTLVAMRRLGPAGAKALRSRYAGRVWLAGTLMAIPLSIPLVNLLVPVLGAASFTHLFHRLNRS
ncbi:EI24 domain-containing protein [Cereibacter changlensis]|uniref:EI24 domain-containing protein n=1 Tax=Cereibacter changlensis TaxID=402884 RepID=UPI0040346AF6